MTEEEKGLEESMALAK